ncbi:MAG: adenosylcobinamide-GDP ribazoletransferase [Sphingomonas adhaesiva]|uniref:adenosylcobinamide-GDP ribazoletransferase n=1 Tax=Sphingomonas adhaesiva TaxID=28212 RepID=UPI002FF724A9
MTPLLLAFAFLTRLPVPRVTATPADVAAAVRSYPLVGTVIGVALALAAAIGDAWTGALAALVVWTAITGALHLDGLADVADGLGAAHGDRTRLIAVMRDPHIGSFGTVTLVVQLLAKLVLLHAVIATAAPLWMLAAVPAAARVGPLVWSRVLPPITPGLGAQVAAAVRARDIAGWALLLAAACVAIPWLAAIVPLIAAFALWARHRLGGINGDGHGAGIELIETGLLGAWLLWA